MARPCLFWSQPLVSCSRIVFILHVISWFVKAGRIPQAMDEIASCHELQCANNNVCRTTLVNGTQQGHAECLCQGQWAGHRCQSRLELHLVTVSTESVTLKVIGYGPPDWDMKLPLEELLIHQITVTYWNLNNSDACNSFLISEPENQIRMESLPRGQEFFICISNGPTDSCSLQHSNARAPLASLPNCVKTKTHLVDQAPLDKGLIIVPVGIVVFIILFVIILYLNRHSLFVHFILNFFCCRWCYCCRRRIIRQKRQKMRRQKQDQQHQLHHEVRGSLLRHNASLEEATNFDLSVASTSLTSFAVGNRSSIVSDSYRSAKSVDSDTTLPPAYQDDYCTLYNPTKETCVTPDNSHFDDSEENVLKRKISDSYYSNLTSDNQTWDRIFPPEIPRGQVDVHVDFKQGYPFRDHHLPRRQSPTSQFVFPLFSFPLTEIPPYHTGAGYQVGPSSVDFDSRPEVMRHTPTLFPSMQETTRRSTLSGLPPKHLYFPRQSMSYTDECMNILPGKDKPLQSNQPPLFTRTLSRASTFPRNKPDFSSIHATLPRSYARKKNAQHFREHLMGSFDALDHSDNVPQETKYDWLAPPSRIPRVPEATQSDWLTLPSRVPLVPEAMLPLNEHENNSLSASKDENVPRKRVKTLIGHFERSLPFLKPSTSSRPGSLHLEDELRDWTSPLAVDRLRCKKKRPRPWSLPVALENPQLPVRYRNCTRGSKPNFDGHPSLHILAPFTTDEEEEYDEGSGENKDKDESSSMSDRTKDSTQNRLSVSRDGTDKFISSYEEDETNLVTPFICKDSTDEDDNNDIDPDPDNMAAISAKLNSGT